MKHNYIIIIINYNNWEDTIECIKSLEQSGIELSNQYIIDNNSTDNSGKKLRETIPDIQLMELDKNIGFSAANNIGIKYAIKEKLDYAILLNNDTTVKSDSIDVLLKEMDTHSEVSIGTGQIRYYYEKNKIWYAGGKLVRWRGLAIHDYKGQYIYKMNRKNDVRYVTFVSGCFLCIRLSDINKLGLLDQQFFLYLEDIEYSARAVNNRLKLLYVSQSIIYHKCRGENQLKENTLYYAVRNRKLLIDKSFPPVAKVYFSFIICYKILMWFFKDKKLFYAAQKGLSDYKKGFFGEIK